MCCVPMERMRNRSLCFIYKFNPSLFTVFFFSLATMFSTTISARTICLDRIGSPFSQKPHFYFQEFDKRRKKEETVYFTINRERQGVVFSFARRLLGGPGSSPPRCASKCGKCTPCKPVHVAVPPGTPVTAEYYPEAWRCKCGNKLFMP